MDKKTQKNQEFERPVKEKLNNKLKFWKNENFKNIIKLIGHYVDLGTDLLFLIEIYNIIQKNEDIDSYISNLMLNSLVILCIHFSIERYKIFRYFCNIFGEVVESVDKSVFVSQAPEKSDYSHTKVKNKWSDILLALLLTLTFTEQIYVKFNKRLQQKTVYSIELSFLTLYFRNALSNLIAFDIIHFQYITGDNISLRVLLSAASSLFSTAYKKSTPFQYLSQETQEFISDPLDIQQLKNFHHIGTHYPDLVKIGYLKQQKQQGRQFNLQNEYYSGKLQISLKKKLYILLVNLSHVIGIVIIQVQVDYSMYYVPPMLRKSLTTLFTMPQFIVYAIIRLKKSDKTLIQKLGFFVLDLIKIPFIHLFAWVQLISPIRNEKIAFVKEVKETWLTNYFPSDYTLIIRQFLYSFWIYCLYQLFENQKGYPVMFFQNYKKLRQVQEITANDSPLKILFWIGFCFQIQTSVQLPAIQSTTQKQKNSTFYFVRQNKHSEYSKHMNQQLSSNNANLLACSRNSYKLSDNNYKSQDCSNKNNEESIDVKQIQQKNKSNDDYYDDEILQELQEQVSARNTEFLSPRKLLSEVYNANDIGCDIERGKNTYYSQKNDKDQN